VRVGTRSAITSIVNEITAFLAAFVVLAHCVAIFWPRKPFKGPVDKAGFPLLWRNETEQSENVTCVWEEDSASGPVPQR
jgi:hypothetical protein